MALDVETPNPPDLTNRPPPTGIDPAELLDGETDFRRAELEEILEDGAWSEAFSEWAEYTELTEAEYQVVRDLGLVEQLDFYWNPIEERLRFETPPLPEELDQQRDLAVEISSELAALARTVVEMLDEGYVSWGEADATESVWTEDPVGDDVPAEDRSDERS